jgi:hypothetical protein
MFEFMRNAFYALVGVLCIGFATTIAMVAITTAVNSIRRLKKGGKGNAA